MGATATPATDRAADPIASNTAVALAYLDAVGRKQFDRVAELLHPDVVFTTPGREMRGAEPYLAALRRLGQVLVRNDVARVVADGDQVCVAYDFVTDTPAGAVASAEWLAVEGGRVRAIRLLFDRSRWSEVLAELTRRVGPPTA